MSFELRRGDEYSAATDELKFSVSVNSLFSDELDMKIEFE